MKSYTDLPQSKKLAGILPSESADMCFNTRNNMPPLMTPYSKFNEFFGMEKTPDFLIPCWSLAALLEVLHDKIHLDNETYYLNFNKVEVKYLGYMTWDGQKCISSKANTIVDACYEMILKLHELKML